MASDDMGSQDAAVIGDDLVEALGFEPISSDGALAEERQQSTSEVAVLDEPLTDEPPIEDRRVDDIEVIDDDPAAEADSSDSDSAKDELLDEPVAHRALVDEPLVDESVVSEAVDEPLVDEPVAEVADTSLFGSPSPVYRPPSRRKVEAEEDVADDLVEVDEALVEESVVDEPLVEESVVDESVVDESVVDEAVDEPLVDELIADDLVEIDEPAIDEPLGSEAAAEVEPDEPEPASQGAVFFNNGIDTDTEPLPAETDVPVEAEFSVPVEVEEASAETVLPPPPGAPDHVVAEPANALVDVEGFGLDSPGLETMPDVPDLDVSPTIESTRVDLPVAEAPTAPPVAVPATAAPATEAPTETAVARVDDDRPRRRQKLRARKSRRVVRHIDPWSVLTFSVLFHLCFFAALLLASVLVWNAALAAGTIENIENFIRELGDYETFEINSDQVFRAAAIIAALLTLASSVLVVLLTVVFNLISDLIGGIRVTVIEEETVRIPAAKKK